MSETKTEISFKLIIEPYDPDKNFYVKFSKDEAQDLYDYVKRDLDVHGGLPVLVTSETTVSNIHSNGKEVKQTPRKKEIEVAQWSKHDPITRGFLPWLTAHGVVVKER